MYYLNQNEQKILKSYPYLPTSEKDTTSKVFHGSVGNMTLKAKKPPQFSYLQLFEQYGNLGFLFFVIFKLENHDNPDKIRTFGRYAYQ